MEQNEKLQQKCVKSDQSLNFLKKVLDVVTVLAIIIWVLIGVDKTLGMYNLQRLHTIVAVIGIALTILWRIIMLALLRVLWDIKVIRTYCTGGQVSQALLDFDEPPSDK